MKAGVVSTHPVSRYPLGICKPKWGIGLQVTVHIRGTLLSLLGMTTKAPCFVTRQASPNAAELRMLTLAA